MGLDPDLPCMTDISFSGDVMECTRAALRVVVLSMKDKYANCEQLMDFIRTVNKAVEPPDFLKDSAWRSACALTARSKLF